MPQRRKATKGELAELQQFADQLPELSIRDMTFVQAYLEGKTAAEAYDISRPNHACNPNARAVEASKLKHRPDVAAHIRAARLAGLAKMQKSAEGWLAEGERLKAVAEATGNVGASVAVWQTQGKAVGHLTDRIEHRHTIDDRALAAQLAAAGFGELAARVLQSETAIQGQVIEGKAETVSE